MHKQTGTLRHELGGHGVRDGCPVAGTETPPQAIVVVVSLPSGTLSELIHTKNNLRHQYIGRAADVDHDGSRR